MIRREWVQVRSESCCLGSKVPREVLFLPGQGGGFHKKGSFEQLFFRLEDNKILLSGNCSFILPTEI